MAEHVIGRLADFPPGTRRLVKIRQAEIGIFNVAGTLYALPNVCTHQFGPLCEGVVSGTMVCTEATRWRHEWSHDGQIIACPWHGLEFDVTTGRCLANAKVRVRMYPVTVEDGQVRLSV